MKLSLPKSLSKNENTEDENEFIQDLRNCTQIDFSLDVLPLAASEQQTLNILIKKIIYEIKKNRKQIREKNIIRTIKMIIGNAIINPSKSLAYSRSPNEYSKKKIKIGYKNLFLVIEALENLGYIESHFIAPRSNSKDRINSRFKLKLDFLQNLPSRYWECFEIQTDNIVEIKNASKKRINPSIHNPKYMKIKNNLTTINATLKKGTYFLDTPLHPPILRRIFNASSLGKGGRFYSIGGNYQVLPKKERSRLLINNDSCVEIDYKGIHLSLLYAQKKLQLEGDPYNLGDKNTLPRSIIKLLVLACLNESSKLSILTLFHKEHNLSKKLVSDTIKLILAKHSLIEDMFFKKDLSLKLQNKDSEIAERVMLCFIDQTMAPILPIHDSFIVQRKHQPILEKIMRETYKEMTNFEIELS